MCLSMWIFEQSRTPRWFQNRVLKWFPEPCVLDRFGMCKCLLRQLHKMREETKIGGNRKATQSNFHFSFSLRARHQWFVPSAQTCCEQPPVQQPPVPQPSTSGTATAKLINIGSGNPRNESYRLASSGLPQKLFGCLLLKKRLPFYTCIKHFDLVS